MTDPVKPCPFCARIADGSALWLERSRAVAFPDGFPVSAGHTLVVPRRHTGSWFDLSGDERQQILDLLDEAHTGLTDDPTIEAFNVGINDRLAAGQTVPHVHVHLIPRRRGDVVDPRGGIRWILADKAAYWDREAG